MRHKIHILKDVHHEMMWMMMKMKDDWIGIQHVVYVLNANVVKEMSWLE